MYGRRGRAASFMQRCEPLLCRRQRCWLGYCGILCVTRTSYKCKKHQRYRVLESTTNNGDSMRTKLRTLRRGVSDSLWSHR